MIHCRALLLAMIVVLAAGGGSDAETAIVGSLDCTFTQSPVRELPGRNVTCTFLPRGGGESLRFAGKLTRSDRDTTPMTSGWVAWGVYSTQAFRPSNLQGEYRNLPVKQAIERGERPSTGPLSGGAGNSIRLHPLTPTPGETPSVNLAFGTTELVLRSDF